MCLCYNYCFEAYDLFHLFDKYNKTLPKDQDCCK